MAAVALLVAVHYLGVGPLEGVEGLLQVVPPGVVEDLLQEDFPGVGLVEDHSSWKTTGVILCLKNIH